MTEQNSGYRFMRRIEELLHKNTLPPETVFNIIRTATADPGFDPIAELNRLERNQKKHDESI
jgi:hypothetical protein